MSNYLVYQTDIHNFSPDVYFEFSVDRDDHWILSPVSGPSRRDIKKNTDT